MRDKQTNCSDVELPGFVGPKEVGFKGDLFSSNISSFQILRTLDHWSTALYIILALQFIPIKVMSVLTFLKVPKT